MKNRLNLQLFTDYMNATTSAATGNNLAPEMKTFYDKNLIRLAEPYLVHDQFAQKRNIPAGEGKVINFRQFTALPKITSALTEGVAPDGQALDVSQITATVAQYGGYVKVTDLLQMTAIDPVITEATALIASQAGRSLDTITREVLAAGTNVLYSGSQSARTDLASSHILTVADVRKAARILEHNNAPKIDGYYIGIIHPDEKYDLMSDPTWVDWQKYTSPEHMYKNEIGQIAGVRFVESTEAKIFEDGGASSADVYATIIFGKDAYGTTEIEVGGLETIIKNREQAGGPLNQYSTIGWKATKAAKILVQNYIVRIESGCTYA